MAAEGELLKLKSSQGEIFEVEPEVACMSNGPTVAPWTIAPKAPPNTKNNTLENNKKYILVLRDV